MRRRIKTLKRIINLLPARSSSEDKKKDIFCTYRRVHPSKMIKSMTVFWREPWISLTIFTRRSFFIKPSYPDPAISRRSSNKLMVGIQKFGQFSCLMRSTSLSIKSLFCFEYVVKKKEVVITKSMRINFKQELYKYKARCTIRNIKIEQLCYKMDLVFWYSTNDYMLI